MSLKRISMRRLVSTTLNLNRTRLNQSFRKVKIAKLKKQMEKRKRMLLKEKVQVVRPLSLKRTRLNQSFRKVKRSKLKKQMEKIKRMLFVKRNSASSASDSEVVRKIKRKHKRSDEIEPIEKKSKVNVVNANVNKDNKDGKKKRKQPREKGKGEHSKIESSIGALLHTYDEENSNKVSKVAAKKKENNYGMDTFKKLLTSSFLRPFC